MTARPGRCATASTSCARPGRELATPGRAGGFPGAGDRPPRRPHHRRGLDASGRRLPARHPAGGGLELRALRRARVACLAGSPDRRKPRPRHRAGVSGPATLDATARRTSGQSRGPGSPWARPSRTTRPGAARTASGPSAPGIHASAGERRGSNAAGASPAASSTA